MCSQHMKLVEKQKELRNGENPSLVNIIRGPMAVLRFYLRQITTCQILFSAQWSVPFSAKLLVADPQSDHFAAFEESGKRT